MNSGCARTTISRRWYHQAHNPALDDIADPFEVARILGVHISELKARPMKLHGVGRRGGAWVNDFYTKDFLGFLFSPQAFLAFQRHQPR
jgi:hypothetical protein